MGPKPEVETAAAAAVEGGDATPKGGKGEGKGKGKGKGAASNARKASVLTKAKALAQIISLTPDDDEREATSKKISWILRKGAARIGVAIDDNGWVKFSDLLNCDLLEDVPDRSEEKLMANIDESNAQKLRYELKDGPGDDGKLIRALKKEERKSKSGAEPGAKPEGGSSPGGMQVETDSKLNGNAKAFVPGQNPAAAAAASSPMGAYPGMGYPGFGYSPFGFPMPYGYPGYGYPGYGAQPAAAAAPKDDGKKRFQGRVKSFNTEKGYGFIESGEAYGIHGRDVFLHKAHLGEHAVGAFVSFVVEINKQGMPQGRDLAATDGSGAAKGKGKGKGKGKKGEGKGGEKKEKGKGAKKDKDDKADDDGAEKKDDAEAKEPGPVAKETAEAVAPAADAETK